MADSEDVARALWDAAIPLQLVLDPSEVTSLPAPPPFYALVPRVSYLHMNVADLLQHFEEALPPGDDQPWFEYKGLPLKWNVPVGVLHDLLASPDDRPWRLVVHFRSYPAALLPYGGAAALQAQFLNSLKEALFVLQGSAAAAMGLPDASKAALWGSIAEGRLEDHSVACAGLLKAGGGAGPKRVPVRVYVRVGQQLNWESVEVSSRAMEQSTSGGEDVTLGLGLSAVLPGIVISDEEGGGGTGGAVVLVGGVRAQLSAPLGLLHQQLKGPDHFLHVCVLAA